MTIETILRFTPDFKGALEAAIESVQTAIMRAPEGSDQHGRLIKALAELRAINESSKPSFGLGNFGKMHS